MKINSKLKSIFSSGRAAHIRLGRTGEKYAAEMLKSKGFSIICRNWKEGKGELDIVARDGFMLGFVEVKSKRVTPKATPPRTNLRPKQIKRIRFGAEKFLWKIFADKDIPHRFDLIEVWMNKRRPVKIFHHQHCFRAIKPR